MHFKVPIKNIDEEYSECYGRLDHVLRHPLAFPGKAGSFHPLSLMDIVEEFERNSDDNVHSYRTIVWRALRRAPLDLPQFRASDSFLARMADNIDYRMQDLENRYTGTLDTLASFLPPELKCRGRRGGYLNSIQIP